MRRTYFYTILTVLTLAILSCSLMNSDTGPAVPPEVLFQDNFSDPSSGWDQVNEPDGITDYVDGVYRIFVNTNNTDVWANPGLDFTDTVLEVNAVKMGGPDDNDFGIICRYQDLLNFYFFMISSDGYYGIAKVVDGEQTLVGMENMDFSETINQGNAKNQLRADCIGQKLAFYVNGQKLIEVVDSQYSSGDVGLIAGTFDEPGTDIHFDDFVVRKP